MRSRFFSRRALGLHALALVVIAACLALGWWQLSRALSGNTLSWVYTFEWPFFAIYAGYMWWKLLNEPLKETRAAEIAARAAPRPEPDLLEPAPPPPEREDERVAERLNALGFDPYDESDPELAAYNRYLASLHASDGTAGRRRRTRSR